MKKKSIIKRTVDQTKEIYDFIGQHAMDGWQNILTGIGMAGRDKRRSSFVKNVDQMTEPDAEELYQADPLARKIIDKPAEEALRRPIEFDKVDKATVAKITTWMDKLNVTNVMKDGDRYGFMYGGAGVFMSVDDGLPLDEPLDLLRCRDIKSLVVLNRWELWTIQTDVIRDINNPMYGYPEFYYLQPRAIPSVESSAPGAVRTTGGKQSGQRKPQPTKKSVTMGTGSPEETQSMELKRVGQNVMNVKIHHTRIIRFDGVPLPIRKRMLNNYWDDSIFTSIKECLADFGIACSNVANIIQDYSVAVYTMQDLASLVGEKDNEEIKKIFSTMSLARSMLGAFCIREGEKFEWSTRSTAGLAELIDRVKLRLQSAVPFPHTILFNESAPGSLTTSDDGNQRKWYDWVSAHQTTYLQPRFNRLFEVMHACTQGPTGGKVPANWEYSWPALWAPSDDEVSKTRYTVAQTDEIYVNMGALDAQEVRESRFGGEAYSMETKLIDGLDPVGEKKDAAQAEVEAQSQTDVTEKDVTDARAVMDALSDRMAVQGVVMTKILYPTLDYAYETIEKLTGTPFQDTGARSTRTKWVFDARPLGDFDPEPSKFRRYSPMMGVEIIYGELKKKA